MIHILIGGSVFLTPVLKHVPMAVLYGVFLYMGVTSLAGVQVGVFIHIYIYLFLSLFLSLSLSLSLSQCLKNHMSIPPLFNYDYLQFVQRITILLMPQKGQPDYIFLRHVETKRVHTFTFIQIICMLLMWVTKSIKSISILFPLLVC